MLMTIQLSQSRKRVVLLRIWPQDQDLWPGKEEGWCWWVPPLCPFCVWRAGAALLWGSRGGEDLLQQVPCQELWQGRLPHQVGILQPLTYFYHTFCRSMIFNHCQFAGFASIPSTCLGSTKCCPVLELIGWLKLSRILSYKNTKWWSNIRALDYESHDL